MDLLENGSVLLGFLDYELDTDLFELRRNGRAVPLEPQVFDLLSYLARHRSRIVPRQELLDHLWPGKVISEATLNSCVKAARQAVGDNGQQQRCIATQHRRGYRFVAEAREIERADDDKPAADVAFITVPARSDRPTLAVLPFACGPGEKQLTWNAEMLRQDISMLLARIPGFLVISRNSADYYRDREYSILQAGKDLGVDYVIEGSVWNTGNQLRVSLQLLETASGSFLWADRTDLSMDELDVFQEDAVRTIVGRIEPALNRAELSVLRKHRPVDLGAWDLYRQGHAILSLKGWNEESFSESASLLRQAIAADPQLAFAHAYLALILAIGHLIGLVNDETWFNEAIRAAEAAVALDNLDSDVLGYAGCAFADMGDYHRGVGMMRRAVELDPSNAQAYSALGAALLRLGKIEGVELMRHGLRLSPRDNRLGAWGAMLALGLLNLGRVGDAIEAAEEACRCDDKIFLPRLVLAMAHYLAGHAKEAQAALEDARRIRPQLSADDLARLAGKDAVRNLQQAGLI